MKCIFLIGMMGSGKTYWGKKLAALMNVHFYDLDDLIEQTSGISIAEIFETQGEDAFRKQERDCLRSIQLKNNFILAAGGGTPCFYGNMDWMNMHGITIWIDEPLQLIAHRLFPEKAHRPLIKNIPDDKLLSFLTQKREERKQYYSMSKHHLYQNNLTEKHFSEILSNE